MFVYQEATGDGRELFSEKHVLEHANRNKDTITTSRSLSTIS